MHVVNKTCCQWDNIQVWLIWDGLNLYNDMRWLSTLTCHEMVYESGQHWCLMMKINFDGFLAASGL